MRLFVGVAGDDPLFVVDWFGALGVDVLDATSVEVAGFVRRHGGLVVHVAQGVSGVPPAGFCVGDLLVDMSHDFGWLERLLGDAAGDWLMSVMMHGGDAYEC